MHGSNSTRGDILPSKKPFVVARADFEKLYPVYQKMGLALVQTGDVLIVDTPPALTGMPSAERQQSDKHVAPPLGGGGSPSQSEDGGSRQRYPQGAGVPAPLGYYRLIRNGASEWKIEGVT
jgi:hypothetical protein